MNEACCMKKGKHYRRTISFTISLGDRIGTVNMHFSCNLSELKWQRGYMYISINHWTWLNTFDQYCKSRYLNIYKICTEYIGSNKRSLSVEGGLGPIYKQVYMTILVQFSQWWSANDGGLKVKPISQQRCVRCYVNLNKWSLASTWYQAAAAVLACDGETWLKQQMLIIFVFHCTINEISVPVIQLENAGFIKDQIIWNHFTCFPRKLMCLKSDFAAAVAAILIILSQDVSAHS